MTAGGVLADGKIAGVALALLLAGALPARAQGKPAAEKASFEEKLLATVPPEHDVWVDRKDPNGADYKEGGFTAVFSPEGRRVAYTAGVSGSSFAVIDGKKGEVFTYADSLVWSADGKRVAYRAGNRIQNNTAEKWWIVEAGKKLCELDQAGRPAFSPDGKHVAAWGNLGGRIRPEDNIYEGGRWHVVLDGKLLESEHERANGLVPPVFSPDGKTIAAVAERTVEKQVAGQIGGTSTVPWLTSFVYLGSKESEPYEMADVPVFSPDGKRAAWGAMKNGRWWVFEGDRKLGGGQDHAGVPVYSPDGKTLAWRGRTGEKEAVFVAGKRVGGSYEAVGTPVFSPDGKQVAFCANRGGKVYGPPAVPGGTTPVLLQRGSESFVYEGTWHLVLGEEDAREEHERADSPVFSPDGKTVAFRARKAGKWTIVAGTTASAPFDDVSAPVFSQDGKKIAFGARAGRELWWRVLELK
ncbi:PD40 domain-containing protein [bacterium]|nr:PD40 domain-containing protein [bacterium]